MSTFNVLWEISGNSLLVTGGIQHGAAFLTRLMVVFVEGFAASTSAVTSNRRTMATVDTDTGALVPVRLVVDLREMLPSERVEIIKIVYSAPSVVSSWSVVPVPYLYNRREFTQDTVQGVPMRIAQDMRSLAPSAIVTLFEINLEPLDVGEVLYLSPEPNELRQNVVWQGVSYPTIPIEMKGFEVSTRGVLPRPRLSVSNLNGVFGDYCRQYQDLVGAKVIRRRTLARFLDAVNFEKGNPEADSTQAFPDEIYILERKVSESRTLCEFELALPWDQQGIGFPRRVVLTNLCNFRYRGEGCAYAGAPIQDRNGNTINALVDRGVWDAGETYITGDYVTLGNPYLVYTAKASNTDKDPRFNPQYWVLDYCTKKLSRCELTFGKFSTLPYGGFPGALRAGR